MTSWELSARTLILATLADWRQHWPIPDLVTSEMWRDLERRLIAAVSRALATAARERLDA